MSQCYSCTKTEASDSKAENKDLDSMVNDSYNSTVNDVGVNENITYNENGATLPEQDNLMAHYTTAGTYTIQEG